MLYPTPILVINKSKYKNRILKESKLKIIPASDLSDAAEKIVKEIN